MRSNSPSIHRAFTPPIHLRDSGAGGAVSGSGSGDSGSHTVPTSEIMMSPLTLGRTYSNSSTTSKHGGRYSGIAIPPASSSTMTHGGHAPPTPTPTATTSTAMIGSTSGSNTSGYGTSIISPSSSNSVNQSPSLLSRSFRDAHGGSSSSLSSSPSNYQQQQHTRGAGSGATSASGAASTGTTTTNNHVLVSYSFYCAPMI
jgi:hypothetical protein